MKDLPVFQGGNLLASWSNGEDAALWRIDDERIGILTVDFITPVVDNPGKFGEIAAANSLSDVFAMGGAPLVALNVVGFPSDCEPMDTLKSILEGGAKKIIEAGAVLAGGHSIQDREPKYGLVVFGEVRSGQEWRTSGARPGDALVITKPLGTGIAVTAMKANLLSREETAYATAIMCGLNDLRTANMGDDLRRNIHACTDVTGFGLAGHALDMIAPDMSLTVYTEKLPLLPGVVGFANMGLIPAGTYANRAHSGKRVSNEAPTEEMRTLANDVIYDPQTSGGLLLAVEWDAAEDILKRLRPIFSHACVIGEFSDGEGQLRVI